MTAEANIRLDDHVDVEIASYLNLDGPRSFFLFAGAGSGKTRSLVKALDHIRDNFERRLKLRGQKVAVITYTNAACDEIIGRIESDPLFEVRTIHSFSWEMIKAFHKDIREWLRGQIQDDIVRLLDEEERGRAGTKASITRQSQIESKGRRLERLDSIRSFSYSPTGDNKEPNSLNHSEVISLFAYFLTAKPLMQRILVEQFPFLLIDESQDTAKGLVDAFLVVERAHKQQFALGLIGDTMQRIYNDGKERIEADIPDDWGTPEKKLNHRCPERIVRLVNQIRSQVDDHVQEPRTDREEGWVRLFLFPADAPEKREMEDRARKYMAELTGDELWNDIEACKILTLEHHMAAKRMGFAGLFEALQGIDDYRTGLLDGSLPATRFFAKSVLPLVRAEQRADRFAAARVVRELSPLISADRLKDSEQPLDQVRQAKAAVENLMTLWQETEPSFGAVLQNLSDSGLFAVPDSLQPALQLWRDRAVQSTPEDEEADPLPENMRALLNFLDASFAEIEPYARYVTGDAHFDTHQGVKGRQFKRVMVLMDDADARGFMFGYDKLLGAKEPTAADIKNESEGKDNSNARTRRLFYVTCSRTQSALALVDYSPNPDAVKATVLKQGWFSENEVVQAL